MAVTDNYKKHTHKNPIEKFLIGIFYAVLLQEITKLKPQKILDVGCGEGFTLKKLADARIGKTREGIEYSDEAIRLGKKLFPAITITKGSIYELPYKANSFDVVVCTEVLEHLDDPKKAFQELARVSSNYVVLTVPNEPFWMMAQLLRGKNIRRFGNDIEHINHWTVLGFRKFVGQVLRIRKTRIALFWTL